MQKSSISPKRHCVVWRPPSGSTSEETKHYRWKDRNKYCCYGRWGIIIIGRNQRIQHRTSRNCKECTRSVGQVG